MEDLFGLILPVVLLFSIWGICDAINASSVEAKKNNDLLIKALNEYTNDKRIN